MITENEYIAAQKLIKEYQKEQLEQKKLLGRNANTSIPPARWGVHETHCCFEHGCKYGDSDCPVELGIIDQEFPCEMCDDEYLTVGS
jgi:hypothetical protein